MRNVKLIASDMDQTLLTSKGVLPPHFDRYLHRLHQAGIEFVAASGRPLYTLQETFPHFSQHISLVCDNGGLVATHGHIIGKSLISAAKYREIVSFILEKTDGVPVLCALDAAYINAVDAKYAPALLPFYHKLKKVPNLLDMSLEVDKVTIYFPNADSRKNADRYFRPVFGQDYTVQVSGETWLDIQNLGVNKGRGMRILSRHFDIPTAQMMAFGDYDNDIPMLETVGYSYIMANATQGMAQHAKYRTRSNDEYGVLHVMDQVLQAQEG
ncbi:MULTISPECIES: HAD family hydrolase [Lacticaseibacillus]|jgi:Cof subfamily protein (haloacid dehalogenase superfamily)|uniref:HAD family hydrolase n=4 Tax=Lacticaseibacillus TaxID=2759736 RepID=A0AAN1C6N8_LACCA|nr:MULTISPECIES: HAD family hydrolase [Lacticaseibacillus]ARY90243.1 HAD family hydrolase [Lacticaseibacillus casei]KAB1970015.1 HAD family hydrolase [Lacticaseibacillus casei]MDE3281155.1 HAD family hydrolase [Lacticaseibacillus casei]MDG3062351.1 HAD family hydrolase [Lacticaseibacillus sp. BCRC 81376]QVI36406.1 HAD family hydrolase [Lacticaseibacillus casei]